MRHALPAISLIALLAAAVAAGCGGHVSATDAAGDGDGASAPDASGVDEAPPDPGAEPPDGAGPEDALDAGAEVDDEREDSGQDAADDGTAADSADGIGDGEGDGDGMPNPLVLVHGYLGRGSDWDEAKAGLVAKGWDPAAVFAPSLGDTNDSIIDLAGRLDAAIRPIVASRGGPIDIVGHSLGGPVVRYWISQMGGAALVEHSVSIMDSEERRMQ